jgi:hypothetical protein
MAKFLSCSELYETIQQKSSQTKNKLWVCSPQLGSGAHMIFSQEILKNSPADIRLLFQLNDASIQLGQINPYEIQYLMEHLEGVAIKVQDTLNANLYIFDDSALVTSANLTENSFENNTEVGLILEDEEATEIKAFFDQNLWQNPNAKNIGNLKQLKKTWNLTQKSTLKIAPLKKYKSHTKINDWTDDYVNSWYIGVLFRVPQKIEHKVKKETSWTNELLLVADIGYNAFKQLKLGDLTYIANLYKRSRTVEIQLARVFDKAKVETDSGDLHLACQIEKTYQLERARFPDLLKNINIHSRASETMLNQEQLKLIKDTLASIKHKRKRAPSTKKPTLTSQVKVGKQKVLSKQAPNYPAVKKP